MPEETTEQGGQRRATWILAFGLAGFLSSLWTVGAPALSSYGNRQVLDNKTQSDISALKDEVRDLKLEMKDVKANYNTLAIMANRLDAITKAMENRR